MSIERQNHRSERDAEPRRVILSWSGGKDSSLALQALLGDSTVRVAGLLTTVTAEFDRISMHGVRRELLERQADALRMPLHVVEIEPAADNQSYGRRMAAALSSFRTAGIGSVAFGDLHLGDVREFREAMMAGVGMKAEFPLWGLDTSRLARDFIDRGFRAIATCVDTQQIEAAFAGRWFDEAFLRDLPSSADPCGENGEFHTFVVDGPIFSYPLTCAIPGDRVLRDDRFQFCDLLPG
jgi:uncharacterized protein (TIGR00290 family)